MTHNPLMSRERIIVPDRKAPTKAQMAAAWSRENGICYLCGRPVAHRGEGVQYDHRIMRNVSADDSEANLYPTHPKCHAEKTYGPDAKLSAKVRGQERLTRPREQKAGGFRRDPNYVRGIDGRVRPRKRQEMETGNE